MLIDGYGIAITRLQSDFLWTVLRLEYKSAIMIRILFHTVQPREGKHQEQRSSNTNHGAHQDGTTRILVLYNVLGIDRIFRLGSMTGSKLFPPTIHIRTQQTRRSLTDSLLAVEQVGNDSTRLCIRHQILDVGS